ncbi:MAG: hypothetical protein ACLU9S_12540 [Oscillospiraceae bacterium]
MRISGGRIRRNLPKPFASGSTPPGSFSIGAFRQATVQCNARMTPAQTATLLYWMMAAALAGAGGVSVHGADRELRCILELARTIADLDSAKFSPSIFGRGHSVPHQ